MNKEEFKKTMQDIILSNAGKTSMQILNAAIETAEDYATSQTSQLEKEIEELRKRSEWINVEDRLPNEFSSVLVVGNNIRSCALYRDKIFYSDFPLPKNEEITHWMPLPPPPINQ